jgi:hypothetical protein
MANRNDSDARQHETLPGFGAAPAAGVGVGHHHAANEVGGVRPVEQMVDSAIERIAREQGASAQLERERPAAASALAKVDVNPMPARLRWKGLDVSDEFREYAERVARGEDLPPFEGRVLAEPNPAFPWGAPPAQEEAAPRTGSGAKVAVWSSVLLALGLIGWSLVPRVEAGSGAPLQTAPELIATDRLTIDTSDTDVTNPEGRAALEGPAPEVTSAALMPAPSDSQAAAAAAAAPSDVGLPVPLAEPPAVHSSVAPTATEDAPHEPLLPPVPAPPTVAPTAAVPPKAPPRASFPAPVTPPPATASAPQAAPAPAVKSVPPDEFGIMELEPGPAAPRPSGAAPPGAVRKEPGSESSAKGSLLVETPSF